MPTDAAFLNSLAVITERFPNFSTKIGIILGSGVGKIADEIASSITIPYQDMPALRACQVQGHQGILHLGTLNNYPIACFQGRNHFYEGHTSAVVQAPIRMLKRLGAEIVLLISAVGSLNPAIKTGQVVAISDHINLQFLNPLVGANEELWGPRFPAMENAYDSELRKQLRLTAKQFATTIPEAILMGVLGPSFETPAEIRAFRTLGADVVGMSTVAEVITARHCGIKVLALSVVTNMAAGMNDEAIDHASSLQVAGNATNNLLPILLSFMEQFYKMEFIYD